MNACTRTRTHMRTRTKQKKRKNNDKRVKGPLTGNLGYTSKNKQKKDNKRAREPSMEKPPTPQHIMTMTYLPAIPPACHRCASRGRAETAAPAQKAAGRRRRAGGADGSESCGRPGKASAATDPGCGCTGCSAASAERRTEQGLSPCVGNQIGTLFVRIKTQQAHFRGNPLAWQGIPPPPSPAETQTEQGLSPCIAR